MQRGRCRYANPASKCKCACNSDQHGESVVTTLLEHFGMLDIPDSVPQLLWHFRNNTEGKIIDAGYASFGLYDLRMIYYLLTHPELKAELDAELRQSNDNS